VTDFLGYGSFNKDEHHQDINDQHGDQEKDPELEEKSIFNPSRHAVDSDYELAADEGGLNRPDRAWPVGKSQPIRSFGLDIIDRAAPRFDRKDRKNADPL